MTLHGFPSPDQHAAHLARMPIEDARKQLENVLGTAMHHQGVDQLLFRRSLDWNAQLVTCLRKRGVKVWGAEG